MLQFANYLDFFLGGMLGFILSVAVKMRALQVRDEAANLTFSPIDFFKQDWLPLFIQFWVILIALYLVRTFAKIKPDAVLYVDGLFVGIGYMGSSLLLHALSRYEKKWKNVIDEKTNVADATTGETEKSVVKLAAKVTTTSENN